VHRNLLAVPLFKGIMALGDRGIPACVLKEEKQSEETNSEADPILARCINVRDPLSIRVLNLSNQDLSEIKFDLTALKNATEIDLSHNKLTDLPDSLSSLNRLCVLNLSHNMFSAPPKILFTSFSILKKLDLSHNLLTDFPKPPLCLPMLQTLDLSHNKLASLLHWLIESPPGLLKSLNLGVNHCFERLGSEKHLQGQSPCLVANVVDLDLSNCCINVNKLKYLKNFPRLKSLSLGNSLTVKFLNANFLEDFDVDCLATDSLTKLFLPNCGLASFPKELDKLKSLEVCDVSHNKLCWLPSSFGTLKHLRILNLSNCKLIALPEVEDVLANLEELLLSHNDISSIPESFLAGGNLTVLDLYDNLLDEIIDFSNFTKLKALDVNLNFLDAPETIEINSKSLQYKDMRDNLTVHLSDPKRMDGRKFEEVNKESEDEEESSVSDCSTYSSNFAYVNTADYQEPLNESWDDIGTTHDEYIPTTLDDYEPSFYSDFSLRDAPYEIIKSEHFFQPYTDQPSIKVNAGYNVRIEEGQFDDC